jgi:hypothetical protein
MLYKDEWNHNNILCISNTHTHIRVIPALIAHYSRRSEILGAGYCLSTHCQYICSFPISSLCPQSFFFPSLTRKIRYLIEALGWWIGPSEDLCLHWKCKCRRNADIHRVEFDTNVRAVVDSTRIRFEVLPAGTVKISVSWDITLRVTPCLLSASCCFLACLTLHPWGWRRHVPRKRRLTLNGLHGVISQEIVLCRIRLDRVAHVTVLPSIYYTEPALPHTVCVMRHNTSSRNRQIACYCMRCKIACRPSSNRPC